MRGMQAETEVSANRQQCDRAPNKDARKAKSNSRRMPNRNVSRNNNNHILSKKTTVDLLCLEFSFLSRPALILSLTRFYDFLNKQTRFYDIPISS